VLCIKPDQPKVTLEIFWAIRAVCLTRKMLTPSCYTTNSALVVGLELVLAFRQSAAEVFKMCSAESLDKAARILIFQAFTIYKMKNSSTAIQVVP